MIALPAPCTGATPLAQGNEVTVIDDGFWKQLVTLPRAALFGAGAADVVRLRRSMGKGAAFSSWDPDLAPDDNAPLLLIQDLPRPALDAPLAQVIRRVLFPRWFGNRPLCFVSRLPVAAYLDNDITPEMLHDDPQAVEAFLLREQLLFLVTDRATPFERQGEGAWQPLPRRVPAANGRGPRQLDVDADLDVYQQRAQQHVDGPIRVLAPAGSGKTKTLTNRILHLLNEGIPPGDILALAFNRKAAREMKGRLAQRGVADVDVRTFHSLGYRILRRKLGWRYAPDESGKEVRRLLQQAIPPEIPLPPRRDSDPLEPFLTALHEAKTRLPPLADLAVVVDEETVPFGPILERFLGLQWQHQLLTFDDMIYLALRVLLRDDALRREVQQQYRYVLVDEFQDLNEAQMQLLRLLTLPQNNLFAVGDDDQMIYGWRGASVRHILDFEQRFPLARSVILATNYRSGAAIVEHSRRLIGHNKLRVAKDIQPRRGAPAGGVQFLLAGSLWQQAQMVATWIREARRSPAAAWRDFAVLYRYNAYQYALALALDAEEIPHAAVDLGELFRSAVGRDLHAYLTLIVRPEDAPVEALQRTLRRPNKFFTNQFINATTSWAALLGRDYRATLPDWAWERLQDYVAGIQLLQQEVRRRPLSAADLLFRLNFEFQLLAYYEGRLLGGSDVDGDTDAVLFQAIYALASGFATPEAFLAFIDTCRDTPPRPAAPTSDADEVGFSTIHQAKGKEYPFVIYFNLSADGHSSEPDEIEEERRVAYVAATRAQTRLLITAEQGNTSPFLRELLSDPELARFTTGELIRERNALQKKGRGRKRRADDADQAAERAARIVRLEAEIDLRRRLAPSGPHSA